MRHLLVALLLIVFTTQMACAEDTMRFVKMSEIKGLISITDTVPPVYQYELKDGSIVQYGERLPHIKDIRPYKYKHPDAYKRLIKLRNFCRFWLPVIQAGGETANFIRLFVQ